MNNQSAIRVALILITMVLTAGGISANTNGNGINLVFSTADRYSGFDAENASGQRAFGYGIYDEHKESANASGKVLRVRRETVDTPTPTFSPLPTYTMTMTPSNTASRTATMLPTETVTPPPAPTETQPPPPLETATFTAVPTELPATATQQPTAVASETAEPTVPASPTVTVTPEPTALATATITPDATATELATATVEPTVEATSTATATVVETATATAVVTATMTPTPEAATETPLPTGTELSEATNTPLPTEDPTETPVPPTATPTPPPVVIQVQSVNGDTGSNIEVTLNGANLSEVEETLELLLNFDPAVVQAISVSAKPGWEIVGSPEIDNINGTIRVTVRRTPAKVAVEEIITVTFQMVGADGSSTQLTVAEAVADGDVERPIDHVDGELGVTDQPAQPLWNTPDELTAAAVGLRWYGATSGVTVEHYQVTLLGESETVLATTTVASGVTSWRVTGLPSGSEVLAQLVAINAEGQSAPALLRFETPVDSNTVWYHILFLAAREWHGPQAGKDWRTGIEKLITPACEVTGNDNRVQGDDMVTILRIIRGQ